LGDNLDRLGAAYLDGVGVALSGQDVGDAVDGGFEPDRIPGGSPGNDQLQAVFGFAAQPHKPFLGGRRGPLFGSPRGRPP
jgi:hypothetical protein